MEANKPVCDDDDGRVVIDLIGLFDQTSIVGIELFKLVGRSSPIIWCSLKKNSRKQMKRTFR